MPHYPPHMSGAVEGPDLGQPAVFVYGTLRPHQVNWHIAARYCERHEPGVLPNHALFALDHPCAVGVCPEPGPEVSVHGDVLWLRRHLAGEALEELDRFEGHDRDDPARSLYVRERRRVALRSGEVVEAWVYLAGPALEAQLCEARRIRSGTWPGA